MNERAQGVLLVLLAALAIALFVAVGGDDATELDAHGQWMAQTKGDGAWVLW